VCSSRDFGGCPNPYTCAASECILRTHYLCAGITLFGRWKKFRAGRNDKSFGRRWKFFLAVRHETFGGVFFLCLFFTASLLLREGICLLANLFGL
jgi:hypothetical protein